MSTGQFIEDPPQRNSRAAFDPNSARPLAAPGGFDPSSATPVEPSTSTFDAGSAKPAGTFAATKQKAQQAKAAENALRRNWDFAREHPVTEIFDALGSAQRGIGAIAGAIEQHDDLRQTLNRIGQDVFHPGDLDTQGQDATSRDTDSIRALVHAPTHDAIDDFVNEHMPEQLRPYASGILKGGEDMSLQTLSDPTTYLGGGIAKGVLGAAKLGLRGVDAMHALINSAHAAGALKYMPWLQQVGAIYGGMTKAAGTALAAARGNPLLRARTELDPVVDEQGRAARIQIENKYRTVSVQNERADREAVGDNRLTAARVQHYTTSMGTTPQSAQRIMHSMLAGTAEQRVASLQQMRSMLFDRDVARETAQHLSQHGGYRTGVAPMNEQAWADFARANRANFIQHLQQHPVGKALVDLAQYPRALMQASLFLNPLPHGIKNVGTLAYLAGGPRALFNGIRSIATGGVDAATNARLQRIGLDPGYTHELQGSLWSQVIPGWNYAAGALQNAMQRMEESWRSSLLDQLDRKLGPSKNLHDEYLKAYVVNQRLGDYRNVNGLVQAFQAVGGPWVAFRLGIVPPNIIRAVAENPQRVLAVARAQEDLQRNRTNRGRASNTLEFGGPVDDFAKLFTDPVNFMESPASGGALAQLEQARNDLGFEPAGKVAGQLAGAFNPLGGVGDIGAAALGHGMPGPNAPSGRATFQPQSIADRLMAATLAALAIYFQKNPSHAENRFEHGEERRIEQQSRGPMDDFAAGFFR